MRSCPAPCSPWDRALALRARFEQRPADRVRRVRVERTVPPVLVELGELAGVIYRSRRGGANRTRTYVHFFDCPPTLTADPDGRQLFIVGGRYRITRRGIEG